MKTIKKLTALALAMVMVLSLTSMMAFADGDDGGESGETPAAQTYDYDYPLTVTGLGTGDTVKFYQIIQWVGEAEGNVAGWKALSPYDTVLNKDALTAMLVGTAAVEADPDAEPPVEAQPAVPATGMTSELAGQLAALAEDGVDPTTLSGGTATLNNASSGMWMALITPGDANTVYNPVFVSADYNKETGHEGTAAVTGAFADAVAKKSTLTLTKTAANANDYNSDNGKTTAVGDTITFTVNTTIPAYGDVYTNPHFVLTDTLTALELNTESVTITAPTGLTKGTDYTISASTTGYTITFSADYLKTVKAATSVTVTYDADVTTDAENAINEEDNEVSIEYSHNPNQQDDYDVKKDTTQHYTFTLDAEGAGSGETLTGKKTSELVKIGVDAAGNPITTGTETSEITGSESWVGPLEGAVFGLWKNAQCTGEPYKTDETGEDGRMSFAGLDAGTYYLKEISAPSGYVTNTTVHTVVIAAETDTVSVTEYWTGSEWVSAQNTDPENPYKSVTYDTEILKSYTVTVDNENVATYSFTNQAAANSNEIQWETVEAVEHPFELENTQGVELPSTGGIGTTLFYIIGAILVLGAGILLITRRRMNAQ